MILRADNLWTQVLEVPGGAGEALWKYLAATSPGYWFTEAYKRGFWDGKVHLYEKKEARFPTGLLRMALGHLRGMGFEPRVEDARRRPKTTPDFAKIEWLRPYQRAALADLVVRTRGIVQAPPGAGKTEMFVAGGNLLEIPWLILVDTRDLMEQAAARFRSRTGTLAGMVGDGVWRELRWTVAMVQTIDAQLDEPRTQAMLGRVQGLVFDECHLAAGDRNMKILMSCPEAYYRWGFSATPTGRKDGMDLKAFGALGPVCHRIREQELVEAGAIAAAKVRFVAHEHEHSVLSGSWTDIESTNIVGSDSRNALVVDMVRRAARPTLVHARRLPHIRRLVALIRSAGLRVDFVQGDTGDRAGRVRRLEHRDLDVLVVSKVFNKGIDIPEARSLVNAAGGDSAIDAVQLLGRPGRATAEKTECEYWDVMDRGDKTLARHAKHRLAALQARGWPCEVLDDVAAPVQGSIPLGPVGG